MGYHTIDGCPCPDELVKLLTEARRRGAAPYNSLYRGDDALALLHANGKHSQRELFAMLGPGVANPPDRGSHILRGDGIVGALFSRLAPWRCGIDIGGDDGGAVRQLSEIVNRLCGVSVYRPYPSGREGHHGNLRSAPPAAWQTAGPPTLKVGSRSRWVRYMTRRLSYIPRANAGTFLNGDTAVFTVRVRDAVKAFQRSHNLRADGVAGPKTYAAIDRSFDYWKKHPLKRAAWVRRGRPD